jgi:cytochrome c oxidase assembly protein subunit 15
LIAIWLLACCAMVFVMVVLGGVTRLTHSGLSMVEWRPLLGWLPPITETAWHDAYEKYKVFPEYQKLNLGMTLEEFKSIFWLEYVHRLWGRAIALVFLVPFLFFVATGRVERRLRPHLAAMFVLGALQGVLGWYMVRSGLVDRPDVSHYRLTAHLGAALLIYAYLLWMALGLLYPEAQAPSGRAAASLRRLSRLLVGLIALTALSGGLVAGLDAGFAYNTFPLMDGRLVPEGLFDQQPWFRNFFENIATVQFVHRVVAVVTFLLVVLFWFRARRVEIAGPARASVHALLSVAVVQVVLGISTLLLAVPVPLAAAHQAGALLLFSAALWTAHALRRTGTGATRPREALAHPHPG